MSNLSMSNFAKKVAVSMCSINMAGITTLMKKQVLTKFPVAKYTWKHIMPMFLKTDVQSSMNWLQSPEGGGKIHAPADQILCKTLSTFKILLQWYCILVEN